jgi:putative transposase
MMEVAPRPPHLLVCPCQQPDRLVPSVAALHPGLKKIKRLHRSVTRKQKGSKNRQKATRILAQQYRSMSNQQANTLHQVTTRLAKTKSVIVIEDLQVAGMLKNHHLAQAISDVGFAEFRRQLCYKAAWYGSRVAVVSRWEPSSKTCSSCGWADNDLTLGDRIFRCERLGCGLVLDRDLNAAINVAKLDGSFSESLNACGEVSAGCSREAVAKLVPLKQEPNTSYSLVGIQR